MQDLYDKIKKIEALLASTQFEGEKQAALSALARIAANHGEVKPVNPALINAKEFTMYTSSNWNKRLLLAVCRKHGLNPFRYHRQKYTTVVVRANQDYFNQVVWKEYLAYTKHLDLLIDDITNELIDKIHAPVEEQVVAGELNA